jgi:tetratricopeptide (TPR) repeat protein
MTSRWTLASIVVLTLVNPATVASEPPAETAGALRGKAFEAAYNLDYPEALSYFNQSLAVDPNSSATHRGLAATTWLHIVFRRGSVTVDQYLGSIQRSDVNFDKPPAEDAASFATHSSKALQLAEGRLTSHPNDVQALYDVGAAVGVIASYGATVEGRVLGSFRQARRAFDTHERVLQLDPSRKDAGLIVGTYRYIVSTLNMPMRWMAYIVGFGGDRALGITMVEGAARYQSEVQTDAKVALLLLYNREGRYDDAIAIARDLKSRFPRNRIFWLEAGSTALRAGRAAEAERALTEGMDRFAGDTRPRAFGEESLWSYKRAAARVALRNLSGAASDLDRAQSLPARDWVKSRIQLERGKLADLQGRRADAITAYRQAVQLSVSGNDDETGIQAKRYLNTPYK